MANTNTGLFVWHDLLTKDPKAAIAFYSDVVGWKTQPFEGNTDYVMWVGSQGPLGGVMKLPDEVAKMGAPPHWMAHVEVENVDATAAQESLEEPRRFEDAQLHVVHPAIAQADGQCSLPLDPGQGRNPDEPLTGPRSRVSLDDLIR